MQGAPPLECKKILMSLATTQGIGFGTGEPHKIDFIDVSRAYFHAKARRNAYIKLPSEGHEEGMVGKLLKAMYGTRDAAPNWEAEYQEFMTSDCKFKSCLTTPCMFYLAEKKLRVVIHGDDFTVLGPHYSLMWFREQIKKSDNLNHKGEDNYLQ